MPRIDSARVRVIVVIVLVILAAAALQASPSGGHPPINGLGVAQQSSDIYFVVIGTVGLLAIVAMFVWAVIDGRRRRRPLIPQEGSADLPQPSATAGPEPQARAGVKAFVVFGAIGVVGVEGLAFLLTDREAALRFSGVALALALWAARWLLGRRTHPEPIGAWTDDSGTALSRWIERTEAQIAWSDSTRADWDRRLRPTLARQFEFASRQARSRNPTAFQATGRVLFGDELWAWVDPDNVSRTGTREKGPGRAVFTAIIDRLERL